MIHQIHSRNYVIICKNPLEGLQRNCTSTIKKCTKFEKLSINLFLFHVILFLESVPSQTQSSVRSQTDSEALIRVCAGCYVIKTVKQKMSRFGSLLSVKNVFWLMHKVWVVEFVSIAQWSSVKRSRKILISHFMTPLSNDWDKHFTIELCNVLKILSNIVVQSCYGSKTTWR